MKKILITGARSYIGTSFEEWMKQFGDDYQIDTLDMRDPSWKEYDFTEYNIIIHLAAIVHVKEKNEQLYYQVNRDLTLEVAKKAKQDGVKQFIFFSTMSVFGIDKGIISSKTKKKPITPYGKSKLQAEEALEELGDQKFIVSILRPPMIYGKDATGNYTRLSRLAKKILIFPKVDNQRSMLYIENLHCFVKLLIDNNLSGVFHPQNREYVNTSNLFFVIGKVNGRTIWLLSGFSGIIHLLAKLNNTFSKVFGTLIYDRSMVGSPDTIYNNIKMEYQVTDFELSIQESENTM
ncbi:NAD-dependent epimerase/dehydratase family protein [Enterococcus sp. LJL99]